MLLEIVAEAVDINSSKALTLDKITALNKMKTGLNCKYFSSHVNLLYSRHGILSLGYKLVSYYVPD